MSIKLRDYQDEAIQAVLAARENGVRRQLVSLATGGGKTIIFSELAKKLNVPTLILAHRDELIQQAVDKLLTVWPQANVGVVKAGQDDFRRPVVVASVQTLARERRLERLASLPWKLMIIDECHHAASRIYHNVVTRLGFLSDQGETPPDQLLLGVTATPKRGDGIGLHEVFEEIVYRKSILDLIRAGYLVDLKGVQILTKVNFGGVKVTRGDFDEHELETLMNTDNCNSLVVRAFQQYAPTRKAIAFTAGVEHARALAGMFRRAGVPADWVCGETPLEQRREILRKYAKGETKVLANYSVFLEGYDDPSTDCIVMARPTKSTALYTQAIGRGSRIFPGKTDCLVLDVAGVSHRHDICSLSSLFGLSRERLARQTISSAVKKAIEAGEKPKDETGQLILGYDLVSRTIDIFQRSQFRWVVSGDTMVLAAGPGDDIFLLPAGEGKYRVLLKSKDGQTELTESPLDVGYAQGVAEDYVRARKKRIGFASKNALWRMQKATEKQINLLIKLGHKGPIPVTAGEVSDLIDKRMAGSRIRAVTEDQSVPWQKRPPTDAQVKFIQSRMRRRPPETRIEAKEMIDEFMARQKRA